MRLLEAWVETPLAGALGWTLVHSLWEGALLAAALAAVLAATRSPRIRYGAACAAMVLMLAGFGLTLARTLPDGAPGTRTAPRAVPAWNFQSGRNAAEAPGTGLAGVVPWLAPLWMAGVWAFYLSQVGGWMVAHRLRWRGVCPAPERWEAALARLRARMRVARPVALLESCLADAPIVVGHFRPAILVPIGLLTGLPPRQVEAILLHELAHIRRFDYLVNVCARLVEGLLFYHPAAWWVSRVIRAERENCCDDVAVAMSGDAREYAEALAAVEQSRWPGREPAVAATGGNLVKRIRRLLYPNVRNGAGTPVMAAVLLLASAAAALAAAWQPQPPPKEISPYTKWLNEDVVYIVTDQERAAFQKLASDAERERFIEQFWERRDPTPGTARNEFKEEHYRRIAYSNEHFPTPAGPGWRADRGRIYIVYGPPDEKENHPGAPPSQPAREVWRYRYLEGIGVDVTVTFIDRSGTGDYRFAPGK